MPTMINFSNHILYVDLSGKLLDQALDQLLDEPEELFWRLHKKVDQPSISYLLRMEWAWLTET